MGKKSKIDKKNLSTDVDWLQKRVAELHNRVMSLVEDREYWMAEYQDIRGLNGDLKVRVAKLEGVNNGLTEELQDAWEEIETLREDL